MASAGLCDTFCSAGSYRDPDCVERQTAAPPEEKIYLDVHGFSTNYFERDGDSVRFRVTLFDPVYDDSGYTAADTIVGTIEFEISSVDGNLNVLDDPSCLPFPEIEPLRFRTTCVTEEHRTWAPSVPVGTVLYEMDCSEVSAWSLCFLFARVGETYKLVDIGCAG